MCVKVFTGRRTSGSRERFRKLPLTSSLPYVKAPRVGTNEAWAKNRSLILSKRMDFTMVHDSARYIVISSVFGYTSSILGDAAVTCGRIMSWYFVDLQEEQIRQKHAFHYVWDSTI